MVHDNHWSKSPILAVAITNLSSFLFTLKPTGISKGITSQINLALVFECIGMCLSPKELFDLYFTKNCGVQTGILFSFMCMASRFENEPSKPTDKANMLAITKRICVFDTSSWFSVHM